MKSILFTFDYELFLGTNPLSSGIVDNCLINPTNKILDLFKKYSLKNAIFFIDTLYIRRLEQISKQYIQVKKDLDKIYSQLERIIELDHYIFPHIHAHWLDAKYISEINQWEFPNLNRYRFEQLNEDEKNMVFKDSINIIKKIYKGEIPNDGIGYRAGGWCIQPFVDFKKFFKEYNIKFDFSVIRESKDENFPWNYNFLNIPDKYFYSFSNCVIKEDKNGEFVEFPISILRSNYFSRAIIRVFSVFQNYFNESPGLKDVISIPSAINKSKSLKSKLLSKLKNNSNPIPFAIERLNILSTKYYSSIIENNQLTQFISHPKLINDIQVKLLEKMIIKCKINNYETNFRKLLLISS